MGVGISGMTYSWFPEDIWINSVRSSASNRGGTGFRRKALGLPCIVRHYRNPISNGANPNLLNSWLDLPRGFKPQPHKSARTPDTQLNQFLPKAIASKPTNSHKAIRSPGEAPQPIVQKDYVMPNSYTHFNGHVCMRI